MENFLPCTEFTLLFCRRCPIFFGADYQKNWPSSLVGNQPTRRWRWHEQQSLAQSAAYFFFAYHFVLLFMKMFGWLITWMPISADIDSRFHYPRWLSPEKGKVTIHSIRNRPFLLKESTSLPFGISFHYWSVKSKNLCQWNDCWINEWVSIFTVIISFDWIKQFDSAYKLTTPVLWRLFEVAPVLAFFFFTPLQDPTSWTWSRMIVA